MTERMRSGRWKDEGERMRSGGKKGEGNKGMKEKEGRVEKEEGVEDGREG